LTSLLGRSFPTPFFAVDRSTSVPIRSSGLTLCFAIILESFSSVERRFLCEPPGEGGREVDEEA
jgi:hypothetical protein